MINVEHVYTNFFAERIEELFGLGKVTSVQDAPGDYRCRNYFIKINDKPYFLKQYDNRLSGSVHEIKFSEKFFAEHGIPIIIPINDRLGRPAFWEKNNWYSLFPFVDGKMPDPESYSDITLKSMGRMLARIHVAGKEMGNKSFQHLRLWDPSAFNMEYIALKNAFERKQEPSEVDIAVMQRLEIKAKIVDANRFSPHDIPHTHNTLLHGDFIYQNVFIDQGGEVTHVYDLEKTTLGPRSYELARSVFISCFDTGWDEKQLEQARTFVSAYREIAPISFQEFLSGLQLYLINFAHLTWVEAKILLDGSTSHIWLISAQSDRVHHLEDDIEDLGRRLYI